MSQVENAALFRSLHCPGKPLVLYNIWDAGGAAALAAAGAAAVATGSWSVAAAHGYDDGQVIPLDFLLAIVGRIAESVSVPLSVDFEGGYANDSALLAGNIRRLIGAGAVGINFEDQVIGGDGLYEIGKQAERIGAVRAAAEDTGIALVINARTDLFLQSPAEAHADFVYEALERAAAYRAAGADTLFVPGLAAPALIERVCREADMPVNVMWSPVFGSVAELAEPGVARISHGPAPYRAALVDLTARYEAAAGH